MLEAGMCSGVVAEQGHVGPNTGLGYYSGVESRTAGCDLLVLSRASMVGLSAGLD